MSLWSWLVEKHTCPLAAGAANWPKSECRWDEAKQQCAADRGEWSEEDCWYALGQGGYPEAVVGSVPPKSNEEGEEST
jgi:hypothetical protein